MQTFIAYYLAWLLLSTWYPLLAPITGYNYRHIKAFSSLSTLWFKLCASGVWQLPVTVTGLTACRARTSFGCWATPTPAYPNSIDDVACPEATAGPQNFDTFFGQLILRIFAQLRFVPTVLVGRKHTPWDSAAAIWRFEEIARLKRTSEVASSGLFHWRRFRVERQQ